MQHYSYVGCPLKEQFLLLIKGAKGLKSEIETRLTGHLQLSLKIYP